MPTRKMKALLFLLTVPALAHTVFAQTDDVDKHVAVEKIIYAPKESNLVEASSKDTKDPQTDKPKDSSALSETDKPKENASSSLAETAAEEPSTEHHHKRKHRHHHHHKHSRALDPKPRLLLDVLKIRERVVVDASNHPISFSTRVHNVLYGAGADHTLHKLFVSDVLVQPRSRLQMTPQDLQRMFTNSPLMQRMTGGGNGHVVNLMHPFDPNWSHAAKPDWFQKVAEKLRLDEFWPRLGVSIALSVLLTALLLLTAKLLVFLCGTEHDYNTVPLDDPNAAVLNRAGKPQTSGSPAPDQRSLKG